MSSTAKIQQISGHLLKLVKGPQRKAKALAYLRSMQTSLKEMTNRDEEAIGELERQIAALSGKSSGEGQVKTSSGEG